MTDYSDYQSAVAPPWMQGQAGFDWNFTLGLTKDAYIEMARRAVRARFVESAPSDALDHIGENFQLDRAFAKNDNVFVAQLTRAWELYQGDGTKPGMLAALQSAGLPNVSIYESYQWLDAYPARWWRFWVVLRPPFPWAADPLADLAWGEPGNWGDGGVWAEGIPQVDWMRLRRIIRKWKPKHATCAGAILLLSGDIFGTRTGTWGGLTTWGGEAVYLDI